MTTIDSLRLRIKALNGSQFTCKDVSNNGEFNTHKFLNDMEQNGEIEFIGFMQTGGRNSKIYVEKDLKPIKSEDVKQKKRTKKIKKFQEENTSPWRSIWPEFFDLPSFQGKSRVVLNLGE